MCQISTGVHFFRYWKKGGAGRREDGEKRGKTHRNREKSHLHMNEEKKEEEEERKLVSHHRRENEGRRFSSPKNS